MEKMRFRCHFSIIFESLWQFWIVIFFILVNEIEVIIEVIKKMGREVLYKAFGYDGNELIPICKPFILHKNGEIEYINEDTIHSEHLDIWKNNSL